MSEVEIANGCVKAPGGTWLVAADQPVASSAACRVKGQKGLFVSDRPYLRVAEAVGDIWCAAAGRPFLVRLDALPDESLDVVSGKVLIAPSEARLGARCLKAIPFSLRGSIAVTEFRGGWAVASTRSRVTRVAVDEGGLLAVRPEALVAWIGGNPTGSCPKLGLADLLLPRAARNLVVDFHGPAVVWFEGSAPAVGPVRRARR